jgi:simple sugar transport system substrate-binding protein
LRTVASMRRAVLLLLLVLVAGCGETKVVREQPLEVKGGAGAPARLPGLESSRSDDDTRIAFVTHGQASSAFWATVRTGVTAAARQLNAQVDYEAPDVYSLPRMEKLIDQAVASKPDGLVVSIPEPGIAPAIRRAVKAGIPVVSINSGSDVFRRLGVLAHVGQPEERAGFQAGQRLAHAGVRTALCVNQQVGNTGLDARCRGLARAMRAVGGSSRVLAVDDQSEDTPRLIGGAVLADGIDGILACNSLSGLQAVDGVARVRRSGRVVIGTFDLGPDVLGAVRAGKLAFAVDQQPYLQGYLPVVMLVNRARYGLFPSGDGLVPTGANFVTRANADKALELSRKSIR